MGVHCEAKQPTMPKARRLCGAQRVNNATTVARQRWVATWLVTALVMAYCARQVRPKNRVVATIGSGTCLAHRPTLPLPRQDREQFLNVVT